MCREEILTVTQEEGDGRGRIQGPDRRQEEEKDLHRGIEEVAHDRR